MGHREHLRRAAQALNCKTIHHTSAQCQPKRGNKVNVVQIYTKRENNTMRTHSVSWEPVINVRRTKSGQYNMISEPI